MTPPPDTIATESPETQPLDATSRHAEPYLDEREEARRFGLERLVFFSDAVFAIAITLLALELRLPDGYDHLDSRQLAAAILDMWPQFLALVISFFVIGQNWMGHHRRFAYIKRYDRTLIDLNLLLLFFVVLLPFPTSVLSETVNSTSVGLYALTVVALTLLTWLMWRHVSTGKAQGGEDMLHAFVTPEMVKRESDGLLATAAVFLFSIVVALVAPIAGMLCWMLQGVATRMLGKRTRVF